ncbi:MAG: BglG family transcription antiterminator [Sarcina sp.]
MREKLILDILREKEIVSLKSITTALDLSERTIRTELGSLNKSGEKNGFEIVNKRGRGYLLNILDKKKFDDFNLKISSTSQFDSSFVPEERVNKIIEIFLIDNEKITIDYIAQKLGYSRSTVIKDLEIVEKKMRDLNLNLERKANKGLRLNNDEISIRKSLSVYLYNNDNDFTIQNDINLKLFSKVKKIFIEEIISNNIDISNLAIENIFCHLKILILRLNNKSFIDEALEYDRAYDKKFLEIAKKICEFIQTNLKVDVPKIELEYLASQICYKSRTVEQENEVKFRATRDIEDILVEIDKKFYTSFNDDVELKSNLVIHLCALISRARANTQLKNPYFDEVNTRYSAIVSIVVNFTDEFCRRWNLKLLKDEIAFITIHFATHFEKAKLAALKNVKKIAIVCPRDGGIQYFLRIRLEENFRNVVIDTYSHLQISQLKVNKYDFIITDRNSNIENSNTPIFEMKNLFDEKEIEKIVYKIESIISSNEDEEIIDGIIFKREIGGKHVNYKKFLEKEAKNLSEMGICKSDFSICVLKREEILSTAYKNGIAAPHGIEMNAHKNFLSIVVFDNAIEWEDKKIDIVFLIAMKKGSLQLHKVIASKIFNLINDMDKRIAIKAIKNEEEFKRYFEKI